MVSNSIHRLLMLPSSLRPVVFKSIAACSILSTSATPFKCFSTSSSHQSASDQQDTSSASQPSSVNQTEVSHFNALASSWWDPHGSSRLLHLMNPLRHDFIRQCLNSHVRDRSKKLQYLDVGCGGGIFAESAARLANTSSVTAIDPSPEVIAVAKRHQRQDPLLLEDRRLHYQRTSIENLRINPADALNDIVTVFEVIEHVRQPSPFLQTCMKHIKPGGWLIGSTIARTNVSWFTTKFMAEDVMRLVPRGTHDWNQYIQPHELQNWARSQPELDAEFQGWQVMGVVYVPGMGWKEVPSSEAWGNYFFGIRKRSDSEDPMGQSA